MEGIGVVVVDGVSGGVGEMIAGVERGGYGGDLRRRRVVG